MGRWSQDRAARMKPLCWAAGVALVIAGCGAADGGGSPGPLGPTQLGPNGQPVAGTNGGMMNPMMGGQLPGAGGTPGSVGVPTAGAMPCAVETVVKSGYTACHGATPIGG